MHIQSASASANPAASKLPNPAASKHSPESLRWRIIISIVLRLRSSTYLCPLVFTTSPMHPYHQNPCARSQQVTAQKSTERTPSHPSNPSVMDELPPPQPRARSVAPNMRTEQRQRSYSRQSRRSVSRSQSFSLVWRRRSSPSPVDRIAAWNAGTAASGAASASTSAASGCVGGTLAHIPAKPMPRPPTSKGKSKGNTKGIPEQRP